MLLLIAVLSVVLFAVGGAEAVRAVCIRQLARPLREPASVTADRV